MRYPKNSAAMTRNQSASELKHVPNSLGPIVQCPSISGADVDEAHTLGSLIMLAIGDILSVPSIASLLASKCVICFQAL